MKFELNFQDLFEIDITPGAATPLWARLGMGISSFVPSTNESVSQDTYLNDGGYASSDVVGGQLTYAGSGARVIGDPAQDFIASLQFELGDLRKTKFRAFNSNGDVVTGPCTLANITVGGGDAAGKKEISFEVHINGKPAADTANAAPALTVTVAPGLATGTTKATITPTPGNTLAYSLSVGAKSANENEYPGALLPYSSAEDIAAVSGQYLNLYELSNFGRIAKFVSHLLAPADIKA